MNTKGVRYLPKHKTAEVKKGKRGGRYIIRKNRKVYV